MDVFYFFGLLAEENLEARRAERYGPAHLRVIGMVSAYARVLWPEDYES